MSFRLFLTLVLASALAAGCASTTGSLALQTPAPTAPAAANSPLVHLVSARVVTPRFGRNPGELPAIEVSVTNRGTGEFVFSQENITAIADSKPVQIYSPVEYMILVDRHAQSDYAAADTRERAVLHDNSAGLGRPGPPPLSAKTTSAMERMEIKHTRFKLLDATREMLRQETIAPGRTFGGVIRLKAAPLLSARELQLRVRVGSETHEIRFALNREAGQE